MSNSFVVFSDRVKTNIAAMAAKAKNSGLVFRPHFKTHQNLIVAGFFRENGVDKITVSSVEMAEYFARHGWSDINIAFPLEINSAGKTDSLASQINLTVLAENPVHIKHLSRFENTVDVMIETDTGYGRSGIAVQESDKIFDLILMIKKAPNLNFAGLLTHFGNTYSATTRQEIKSIARASLSALEKLKNSLEKKLGEEVFISIGDTPSASVLDSFGAASEIRPGNFVFYDLMQLHTGSCELEQIAALMRCPVVSKNAARKQLVIHGGAVHFSKESLYIGPALSYGKPVDISGPKWQILNSNLISLSQEHGIIQCSQEEFDRFQIGDFIHIIPVHSCLTANLMKGNFVFV